MKHVLSTMSREIATNQLRHAEGRIQRLNEDEGLWEGDPGLQAEIRQGLTEAIQDRNIMAEVLRRDQDALREQRQGWVDELVNSGKLGNF